MPLVAKVEIESFWDIFWLLEPSYK
jgi:hypothetical protein